MANVEKSYMAIDEFDEEVNEFLKPFLVTGINNMPKIENQKIYISSAYDRNSYSNLFRLRSGDKIGCCDEVTLYKYNEQLQKEGISTRIARNEANELLIAILEVPDGKEC